MPNEPKLWQKTAGGSTYWYTRAGGVSTYFGSIKTTPRTIAKKRFAEHLARLCDEGQRDKSRGLTAGGLLDVFLDWVHANRSTPTFTTRKTYCQSFARFRVGPQRVRVADLPALGVRSDHLEAWLSDLER